MIKEQKHDQEPNDQEWPITEWKACIKVFLCYQGYAIYRFMKKIESLFKTASMKFEFSNFEIRFYKRQVSFLVFQTVKCKRGKKYAKKCIFCGKTIKCCKVSGDAFLQRLGALPPQTSALLLPPIATITNFVEFLSSAYCVLLLSQRNNVATVIILFLLLPHFCTYFSLQIVQFLLAGAQEYFLPPDAGYPSYTTGIPLLHYYLGTRQI